MSMNYEKAFSYFTREIKLFLTQQENKISVWYLKINNKTLPLVKYNV